MVLYLVVLGPQTPTTILEASTVRNLPPGADDHKFNTFLRLVKAGRLEAMVIGRRNNRVRAGANDMTQTEIQLPLSKRTLEVQGHQLHR